MSDVEKDESVRAQPGRGPAYPYVSLEKAVLRAEQLRDANMARVTASALAIYKVWGWSGDNGNARQTMAALNHFGLVEYVGRGEERQVRLSSLAHRIVLDKVPGSPERAAALREAALTPAIHQKLWEQFGQSLPPDVVLETFLVRDCKFNDAGARNLIAEYRETFEFSGLSHPQENGDPEASIEVPARNVEQSPNEEKRPTPPPVLQAVVGELEREWLRGPLSKLTSYKLIVSGEMGPKEIGKLIKLLEAQKAVLDDEDGEA